MQVSEPHLFLATNSVVDYAAPQAFFRDGDLLVAELPIAKFEPAQPAAIEAVLRLSPAGDGVTINAAPGAVPTGGTRLQGAAAATPSLAWLVLAALAGGLLLNIMPCVFPILSLKALSLARAGESEAQARAEGLAYTAGVIVACLALGGLLLGLRAAGQEVGWAFQLQEPLVVAALLLLAVAITANLLGLYEFMVPGFASEGSPQGAFATGLLAAFAATPCTGPFMAAAMGAALLLPPLPALLLFAALGLGIALPFLAIAWVPALRRRMPKPGPWMGKFRNWMALPMGLTALALIWLASRIGGNAFAFALGLIAVIVVAALVLLGRRQRRRSRAARRPAVQRGGPGQSAGERQAGLRLHDRRLVSLVQGQRACRDRARADPRCLPESWRDRAARRLDPARSGDHPFPYGPGRSGHPALPVVSGREQHPRAAAAGAGARQPGRTGAALNLIAQLILVKALNAGPFHQENKAEASWLPYQRFSPPGAAAQYSRSFFCRNYADRWRRSHSTWAP